MNSSDAGIRINVDPTNPGQFFACCGLLELADRLWPGAEGWFEGGQFVVVCEGELCTLLSALVMERPAIVERLECNGLEIKPIIAPLAFSFDGGSTVAITLDYWTRIQTIRGIPQVVANTPWNFWSGLQKSSTIWLALRAGLALQIRDFSSADYTTLFSQCLFQKKGRFGFDPGRPGKHSMSGSRQTNKIWK